MEKKTEVRKLFDETSHTYTRVQIPDGCADIARGLGYKPEETLWDYDWVHPSESGVRWPDEIPCGDQESIVLLSRGGATGLTLKLYDGVLEYLKEHVGVKDVIEVTDTVARKDMCAYPQHSVIAQAKEKSAKEPSLKEIFNGKAFCSWMAASDVQKAAREMGGKTIVTPEQRDTFNSKVRVVSQAEGEEYNVAPFVIVEAWDQLDAKMQELQDCARSLGIDPQKTKFWIKFDNLAGGVGVKPYEPAHMGFDEIKDWIRGIRENGGMSGDSFHPVIMDIDIASLPDVKRVLSNMCVQAIIGPDGAAITGTTMQRTEDGHYIGGGIPVTDEEKRCAEESQRWALPVIEAAQKQGYVGYAGVDIIMTEDASGKRRGYVLEMNGRLCLSTPLLSTTHWVAKQSGVKEPAAMDFTEYFPPVDDFRPLKEAFNKLLYKGAQSHYSGVIPVQMEPDEQGRIKGMKMIAIAPDAAQLKILGQRCKKVFEGLRHPK